MLRIGARALCQVRFLGDLRTGPESDGVLPGHIHVNLRAFRVKLPCLPAIQIGVDRFLEAIAATPTGILRGAILPLFSPCVFTSSCLCRRDSRAGGFFKGVESDCRAAFAIVTHLSPDHDSLLHEVVGRYTEMPVIVAKDGGEGRADYGLRDAAKCHSLD